MSKSKIIKNIMAMPFINNNIYKLVELISSNISGGFILCWHDLSAKVFKSQVESLLPLKPISLDELINRYKSGKSTKGCFAITFDDGVGKTVKDISNICDQMDWPVTFYLPTAYLNGDPLPYQKLMLIKKYLPSNDYLIPREYIDHKNYVINKLNLIKFIQTKLYTESFKVVTKILDHYLGLISSVDKKSLHNEFPKAITWIEVKELSHNNLLSFQSHGITHTAVSVLSESEIEYEMVKSKNIIEQHTEKRVTSFCYPYGAEKTIGELAQKIANKHYNFAVTLIRGRLRKSNIFYLPRIDIYEGDTDSIVRLKTTISQ
jgi:peptidoglycan/xylan/chitin deacetylase (PgdA/CDA1 family)